MGVTRKTKMLRYRDKYGAVLRQMTLLVLPIYPKGATCIRLHARARCSALQRCTAKHPKRERVVLVEADIFYYDLGPFDIFAVLHSEVLSAGKLKED